MLLRRREGGWERRRLGNCFFLVQREVSGDGDGLFGDGLWIMGRDVGGVDKCEFWECDLWGGGASMMTIR